MTRASLGMRAERDCEKRSNHKSAMRFFCFFFAGGLTDGGWREGGGREGRGWKRLATPTQKNMDYVTIKKQREAIGGEMSDIDALLEHVTSSGNRSSFGPLVVAIVVVVVVVVVVLVVFRCDIFGCGDSEGTFPPTSTPPASTSPSITHPKPTDCTDASTRTIFGTNVLTPEGRLDVRTTHPIDTSPPSWTKPEIFFPNADAASLKSKNMATTRTPPCEKLVVHGGILYGSASTAYYSMYDQASQFSTYPYSLYRRDGLNRWVGLVTRDATSNSIDGRTVNGLYHIRDFHLFTTTMEDAFGTTSEVVYMYALADFGWSKPVESEGNGQGAGIVRRPIRKRILASGSWEDVAPDAPWTLVVYFGLPGRSPSDPNVSNYAKNFAWRFFPFWTALDDRQLMNFVVRSEDKYHNLFLIEPSGMPYDYLQHPSQTLYVNLDWSTVESYQAGMINMCVPPSKKDYEVAGRVAGRVTIIGTFENYQEIYYLNQSKRDNWISSRFREAMKQKGKPSYAIIDIHATDEVELYVSVRYDSVASQNRSGSVWRGYVENSKSLCSKDGKEDETADPWANMYCLDAVPKKMKWEEVASGVPPLRRITVLRVDEIDLPGEECVRRILKGRKLLVGTSSGSITPQENGCINIKPTFNNDFHKCGADLDHIYFAILDE